MEFHVLFHPNEGKRLPKIWAAGVRGDVVVFGSIGNTLIQKSVDSDLWKTIQDKLSNGYLDLGVLHDVDLVSLQALSKAMKRMHQSSHGGAVTIDLEHADVLRTFRKRQGYRCELVLEQVSSRRQQPRAFEGPIVSDTLDSWF
ncbi:hypothetical protein TMEC54S_00405 [Thauera mechernichensis]